MPNRILKETIKYSDQIDMLSAFDETVFYRLIVTVDDYGCYDARPVLLKNELFPTRENITKVEIENSLLTLEKAGLIKRYSVEGRPYLQLVTWEKHQRVRNSVRKFPAPEDADAEQPCGELRQVAASCGEVRQDAALIQSNPNPESNPNPNPNPNPKRTRAQYDPTPAIDESILPEQVKGKVKEWVRYKAERHDKYQEIGFKSLLNRLQRNVDENGASAVIDAIDLSISNGYAGIVWDRIRPSPSQRAAPGSDDDPLMKIIRGET